MKRWFLFVSLWMFFGCNSLVSSWHRHWSPVEVGRHWMLSELVEGEFFIVDTRAELVIDPLKSSDGHVPSLSDRKFLKIKGLAGVQYWYCWKCESFVIEGKCGAMLKAGDEVDWLDECRLTCLA